ncbi:MAG: TRAFAC clade GTPase domain-containing protein [Gemmataceae bacterium]
MMQATTPPQQWAERLCRPQRVGLFGQRGVGKTTFLTMLYREAVSGRLPGLRLAAADARTAEYLSDKIHQLEAGQTLPATLAETELRFHLYHGDTRLELIGRDYQGEHIALGRHEPIWDFFQECDAVWLCLDAQTLTNPVERFRRQQEIEQLIEAYLAVEPERRMDRPIALIITKADLLDQAAATSLDSWLTQLGMTCHALETHCTQRGWFAVSSLAALVAGMANGGRQAPGDSPQPASFPLPLAQPLLWLAQALQVQDETRMTRLWDLASQQLDVLERCLACFTQRYPQAEMSILYRHRLRKLRWQRRRRRLLATAAMVSVALASLWGYEAWGRHQVERFEAENGDNPSAVLRRWQEYEQWHPTRYYLGAAAVERDARHLSQLAQRVHEQQRDGQLAELRRRAKDPDADPEAMWRLFLDFRTSFPEVSIDSDLEQLRYDIKRRHDEQRAEKARHALEGLVSAESNGTSLTDLVALADAFMHQYSDTALAAEVRQRKGTYLRRIDAQAIQTARDYSAKQPFNFQTRMNHYQRYLDKHATDGEYVDEAKQALRTIADAWDRHDFRTIRDHFTSRPGEVDSLMTRCRAYLAVHPQGRFTQAAKDLLRWSEQVTAPRDYRVTLRGGDLDRKIGHWLSYWGPDLSVVVEVNGERYGPSNIVKNSHTPQWNYEFPRPIRWKLGDPVRIIVTDHDYNNRVVLEIASAAGDPLGMRLLSGDAWSGLSRITFESNFWMPNLPAVEEGFVQR